MKKILVLSALLIAGCATPPKDLLDAQAHVRQKMAYKWSGSVKVDHWNPYCPSQGDCEDVAMCLLAEVKKTHPEAELYILKWWKQASYSHVMVKAGDWWMDYNAISTFQPRGEPTHRCELNLEGKVAVCKPLQPGAALKIKPLVDKSEL